MKLILTEVQYRILEAIIDEAALPMSTKVEQGGFIQVVYMLDDTEKSQTIQITDIYGTGKYVKGNNTGGQYLINIGGSLDTENNTFTVLKDGEYQEGGKDENGKIIAPQVVGGTKVILKNVTQINVSDSSKTVVDTISTALGDENDLSDIESDDERESLLKSKKEKDDAKSKRDKEIYDLMVNDPILKKAFYHQPKLFGGILNYGKAKGIGPAKALLNKYISGYKPKYKDDEKDVKGEFNEFKVNKSIIYQVEGKPIRISYGGEDFILEVGKNYPARYVGKQYLKGKVGGISYKIYMKENVGGDIYRGTVKAFFKESDDSMVDRMDKITIKVRDYNY